MPDIREGEGLKSRKLSSRSLEIASGLLDGQVGRWSRHRFRYDHRDDSVLVGDFGLRHIDVVWQGEGALEAAERALHQVVEPPPGVAGRALLPANAQAAWINRNIDVCLAHARHFDLNDDRVRCFPGFPCQQCPLGKVLLRATTLLLRSSDEVRQRAGAAFKDLAPFLGKSLPRAGNATLQLGAQFPLGNHRRTPSRVLRSLALNRNRSLLFKPLWAGFGGGAGCPLNYYAATLNVPAPGKNCQPDRRCEYVRQYDHFRTSL